MAGSRQPDRLGWRGTITRLRAAVGQIAEPAVTFSDWALTAECIGCAALLARQPLHNPLRGAGIAFFGATGTAALLGGIVHAFFPSDRPHRLSDPLWAATLLTLGGAGAAAWSLAARVVMPPALVQPITGFGLAGYGIYGAVVLGGQRNFAVAIAGYLPANLFLFGAFAQRLVQRGERAARTALAGIALTLLASVVQQLRIGVHPRYCDHNALYHLLMGVALPLFCGGVRGVGLALAREEEGR